MNHLILWLSQLFSAWHLTRAAGLTSYVLLFLSVISGILQSLRLINGRRRAGLYAFHCTTCLYGLMFGLVHGLLLLGDSKVSFTLGQILIPFTSYYLPFQTGLGTLALYIMIILVITSRMIKQIGRKAWRTIHFLAFPGYAFAFYHGIAMGTDSQFEGIKLLYAVTCGIVLALVLLRLTGNKRASAVAKPGA